MGFGSLVSAGVSIYGTHQANKNIDKQLQAQQRENALNRAYNLNLAKLQNKWNRQQWQMENAYNSPAAQMERLRQAGLNPDMMYGGGVSGNLSANSPAMTSGAPSSPVDWSALGAKKTVLDMALQSAQIRNIDADTKQKNTTSDNIAADTEIKQYLAPKQYDELVQRINESKSREDANLAETLNKNLEYGWKEKQFAIEYEILQNKLQMSREDTKNFVQYWTYKLAGMQLDNQLKEDEHRWNDPSVLDNLGGEGSSALFKLLMMVFK